MAAPAGARLVRDFIRASLYDRGQGYFMRRGSAVVGALPRPLQFGDFTGEPGYRAALRQAYDELGTSWLTPSEIFRPHYANALADAFAQSHEARHKQPPSGAEGAAQAAPLDIYEVGGGSGGVARDILRRLRARHPAAFRAVRYRAIEISPQLARRQEKTVAEGGADLSARFESLVGDAACPEVWGGTDARECHIFGLEVLDNLPHDLVRRRADGIWEEALVSPAAEGGKWIEIWQPLSDNLISRCLKSYDWDDAAHASSPMHRLLRLVLDGTLGPAADGRVFLPTGCLRLLDTLCQVRPAHRLLLADFDILPDTVIAGRNAPLVSNTLDGQARDYNSFLLPYGTADIFFPTDFGALSALHAAAARQEGLREEAASPRAVLRSRDFLCRASPDSARATTTRSGYNPLLEDFSNTNFFTAGY